MSTSKDYLFRACSIAREPSGRNSKAGRRIYGGGRGGFMYVQVTRNLEAGYLVAGPPM